MYPIIKNNNTYVLYKSENIMVCINSLWFGTNLVIKKWLPKKITMWFYWKEVMRIFINHNNLPHVNMGHKYKIEFNKKENIGTECDFKFSNDLRELNEILGEEVFNDNILAEYEAFLVTMRLMGAK